MLVSINALLTRYTFIGVPASLLLDRLLYDRVRVYKDWDPLVRFETNADFPVHRRIQSAYHPF